MEENLAASDAEDMPRLLKTMSREMPNRELFIAETLKEWDAADTSTHLIEIQVLKHSDAPAPAPGFRTRPSGSSKR
jgi:hypothetical protein